MKVMVFVEGPSDKVGLQALLAPLLATKEAQGLGVSFHETTKGDRKKTLLTKTPVKARMILLGDSEAHVVIIPDLYPPNKGFAHQTFAEMEAGIWDAFKKGPRPEDARVEERFHVFCFKHEFEALLLALPERLKRRAGVSRTSVAWTTPVEDQNHDKPPKRVVEEVFGEGGHTYRDTIDAPAILAGADYRQVTDACPQCFKPFVSFLESCR